MERVDLGPCQAIHHDGDPDRVAVLLPGQFYPTRAPALWFALEVPGDPVVSLTGLGQMTEAIMAFADRV
ncbi:MAG TPA: hypothetical protein VGF91_29950 [Solirubrobacteraceae bacterium]|jgi:hypothetical protein